MKLQQELQNALTTAMKSRNEDSKRTLRLALTAIKLAEVEDRKELDDVRVLSILQKEIKTREDTIVEARAAHRPDLVESAEKEITILQSFLPKQMEESELLALTQEVINQTGATSIRDMGAVMKILIPKLEGRASGQDASKAVRELLQNRS